MYIGRSSLLSETLICQEMDQKDLGEAQSGCGEWLCYVYADDKDIAVFCGGFVTQGF